MKKIILVLSLCLGLALTLTGCSSGGSSSSGGSQVVVGNYSQTFSPSYTTLTVKGKATSINIAYYNGSTVSVTDTLYQSSDKVTTVPSTNPYPPTIISGGSTLEIAASYPSDNTGYSDVLTINIPTSMVLSTISAETGLGSIGIGNGNANLTSITLSAGLGSVNLNATNATNTSLSINLHSGEGSAGLTGASQYATVIEDSGMGSVSYKGAGSTLEATASMGNVNINNTWSSVKATASMGTVMYNGTQQTSPFSLNVPSSYTPQVKLTASMGSISCSQ